jgi:hypothetical protein
MISRGETLLYCMPSKSPHQSQIVARGDGGVLILNLWDNQEGRDEANADPAMEDARRKIIANTGAEAEFANWDVVAHKVTSR